MEDFPMPLQKGKTFKTITLAMSLAVVALLALSACGGTTSTTSSSNTTTSKKISIVAAENFYGSVAQQIGGNAVTVQSILSDPNVDPHTYESNYNNTKAVATANLVIEAGDNYDSWMDKLLSGSPNSSRIVLNGYNIAPTHIPDNPHVWYNVNNVQAVAQAIANSLKKLDPADASTFEKNYQTFNTSLNAIRTKESDIKAKYSGTPVALTETIFEYTAIPMGLKVLTPLSFQEAMAEGNDPPANTVIEAENQINNKQVKTLIYNEQTVSPVTTTLQNDAKAKGIPVTPVTETMPPNKTYQTWMLDQLNLLEQNLGGK
jgi:zinc/manganese transport system substrate-binding protein